MFIKMTTRNSGAPLPRIEGVNFFKIGEAPASTPEEEGAFLLFHDEYLDAFEGRITGMVPSLSLFSSVFSPWCRR